MFVIARDKEGKMRAHVRRVESGAAIGDEVLIHAGLAAARAGRRLRLVQAARSRVRVNRGRAKVTRDFGTLTDH